jgi:hypothetical protein
MEQDKKLAPDALIVLSAGSIAEKDPCTRKTIYRSTTYAEGDSFGTLGGYVRVQAAAELSKKYPLAVLVTTGKEGPDGMSHARIQASELEALGVSHERIILEERSVNTKTQIEESLRLAQERAWKQVLFVTSAYQVERARTFVEHLQEHPACVIAYQDAESVLSESDQAFSFEFTRVMQSESYQRRLAAEARGVRAIKDGTYRFAQQEDKLERLT